MPDYIKLNAGDFASMRGKKKSEEATVYVRDTGRFEFNYVAVERLGTNVSLCAEKSSRNCFAVMRNGGDFELSYQGGRRMAFYCAPLANHVIDSTWERDVHAADAKKPQSMTFVIASLPVDDGENKDVFALIRKK